MKHIDELVKINQMLDIVESRIDLDCIKKDKATKLIIILRLAIANTFKQLEALED